MSAVPGHLVETEVRIMHMVELMLANKWKTGATGRELAAEWGLTYQRVRVMAAEASKIVRQDLLSNAAQVLVPALEEIIQGGLGDAGTGDKIAAVQAAKVYADIAGLTQHEKESEPEHREQTLKVQFVAPERPKEKSE
jgi:hypothetical protein